MLLIDLTWTIQADRERAFRDAARRREARAATTDPSASTRVDEPSRAVPSGHVTGVAVGDGAGRRGDTRPDVGGFQDLNPASRS